MSTKTITGFTDIKTREMTTAFVTDTPTISTQVEISHKWLTDEINEFVADAHKSGFTDTPLIGVEFLLQHMDMDTFGDNLDTYITEQIREYIADAMSDAETTLSLNS